MLFRKLFERESSTYTYLLASRRGGEGLIIDPVKEEVARYLQLIGELELRLVFAIDTHVHADHVTGLGDLREATSCGTIMGAQSRAECVSLVMSDRVFTGDTLLIRSTGWTVSTIGEERAHNPRLKLGTQKAYVDFMRGLKLSNPKLMDVAVPANLACGIG